MKKILTLLLFMVSSFTYATCTPPNGTYTGSFSGYYIDTKTGKYTEYASSVITMIFTSTGSGTAIETGKAYKTKGRYNSNYSIDAIGTTKHMFNTTTCQGQFTDSFNRTYVYVTSNSGAKLSGTYYGDDRYILLSTLVMEKV
jgi:hypothetical protein